MKHYGISKWLNKNRSPSIRSDSAQSLDLEPENLCRLLVQCYIHAVLLVLHLKRDNNGKFQSVAMRIQ